MGGKEYTYGDKWEADCSSFTCSERKTIDGGEVVGATVKALKIRKFSTQMVPINCSCLSARVLSISQDGSSLF